MKSGMGSGSFDRLEQPLLSRRHQLGVDIGRQLRADGITHTYHVSTARYLGAREVRHDWGYGCGTCPACELRRRGWEEWRAL